MLFIDCFYCQPNPKLKASSFWLVVTKTSTICERKLCVIAYAGDSLTQQDNPMNLFSSSCQNICQIFNSSISEHLPLDDRLGAKLATFESED